MVVRWLLKPESDEVVDGCEDFKCGRLCDVGVGSSLLEWFDWVPRSQIE